MQKDMLDRLHAALRAHLVGLNRQSAATTGTDEFAHSCQVLTNLISENDIRYLVENQCPTEMLRRSRRARAAVYRERLEGIKTQWRAMLAARLSDNAADRSDAIHAHALFTLYFLRLRLAGIAYSMGLPASMITGDTVLQASRLVRPQTADVLPFRYPPRPV